MSPTDKKNKIDLLEKTVSFDLSGLYEVVKKKEDTLEVTFSKEKYPILGINVECIENPKINTMEKISSFLCDDLKINDKILCTNDIYKLNYEIKIDNEKLLIWKILHHLKPRSFRLLRFSLTWPDNKEAENYVKPILKITSQIIDSVKFNLSRTTYDDLATLKYKLTGTRYEDQKFWNFFKIKLPKKWQIDYSNSDSFVKIYMNKKKSFYFFIERFEVPINSSLENTDKIVENFIEEITKDVLISGAKLKKSDNNNYLFYFIASENEAGNTQNILQNKIWYRIKVLTNKILIVSAVFEMSSSIELENNLYLEKLNQIIGASEILV